MHGCLLTLAALLVCACAYEDVPAATQALEPASEHDTATLHSQFQRPRRSHVQTLLLQDENVGIRYEYSVPNRRYNWVHEEFTPCNATCGGGFQTRNVTCRSTEDLEVVENNLCDEFLRPPTNQSCSPDPCPVQWVEGPWGECSQRCGIGGVGSREVTCQRIIDNDMKSVPDKECLDQLGPKPGVFQLCNEELPSPKWFIGHWKECDKLCDEGKQTRLVVCYQKKNGRIEVLNDMYCTEKKPEVEQPCMLQPCERIDWVASDWSGCDSCISKNRTRVVLCSTITRKVVDDRFCFYHNRPADSEECQKDKLPPCGVLWYATQWSQCSAKCGAGVQTREVFCGMYYNDTSGVGVKVVEDVKCANLTKYTDTKPCTVPKEECPSLWLAGPWTACTETCGAGEQYRRVICIQEDQESSDCDGPTVLDSTQLCNIEPCEKYEKNLIVEGEEVPDKKINCRHTKFGCCPDKTIAATGPFDEGCSKPRTCLGSKYGCCPDGLSSAQGNNYEGCPVEPCADTLFGCCSSDNKTAAQGNAQEGCPPPPPPFASSEHTAAFGPNNEGCACITYQFGCCADGVTIAKGPDQQGCHCRDSKFGCCGDGETPATGPDAAGCDCSSSRHGCCPDGRTEAAGPNFFGCTDAPENKQAACSMWPDPGSCHNFKLMWYFDVAYGGCSRFWSGGCEGNGNRFSTKKDCEDVCVQPSPKDACKLPSVKGACDDDLQRWHYNSTRKQCMPFRYGGCLGNANNFDTRELCQKQCEPSSVAAPEPRKQPSIEVGTTTTPTSTPTEADKPLFTGAAHAGEQDVHRTRAARRRRRG